MTEVATFLFSAIRVSTPLVFAAIAAVITQQAGLLNMAVESMMLSAALAGVMISGATQSAILLFSEEDVFCDLILSSARISETL